MKNTPYQRLELFWQSLGMKKASAFIDTVPGLTAAALSAMKQRGSRPSAGVMRAIHLVYPDLNTDYILWGTGNITTEAGVPAETKQAAGFGSDVEVAVLRALLADRDKTILVKDAEIARLNQKLGKPFDSPDAADDQEEEDPTQPTGPTGQGVLPLPRLRVQQIRGLIRYQD